MSVTYLVMKNFDRLTVKQAEAVLKALSTVDVEEVLWDQEKPNLADLDSCGSFVWVGRHCRRKLRGGNPGGPAHSLHGVLRPLASRGQRCAR